jgi:transposase
VIEKTGIDESLLHIDEDALKRADISELISIIKDQHAAMTDLLAQNANYEETIAYLSRKLYGRSKEDADIVGQYSLFNETEVEQDPSVPEPDIEDLLDNKEDTGRTKKKKKRGTHNDILGNIPIEKSVLRLKGEDRKCDWCGNEMEVLGEKLVREELNIVPAKLTRVQIYQEVLICKHCKDEDDEPVIVAPAAPKPLIEHSLASPSSVAWIITEKYMKHVPLYRLEKQLAQEHVRLGRSTMANWIITVTEQYLTPLYEAMVREQLNRDLLHADETPCQVLKEPGRKATQKSYIWLYTTGDDGLPPIIIYTYHPSRAHDIPADYLKDFHGYLQTDCYDGYNALEGHLIRCTCWAHLRRYWYDAIPSELQKAVSKGDINKDKPGPAVTGYLYCEKLFEFEKKYKDLAPDERKEKRLEHELPIINRFFDWAKTLNPLGGSKLETAVTYTLNHEQNFRNYLKDGRISVSNNRAERGAKTYVMGRKNFLFHDTVSGANASTMLYSIVETARANNLNVYQYIWFTLTAVSGYTKQLGNIENYLPWTEFIQDRCHISVVGTNEEEDYS